jgi:hypothetical protein
MRIYSVEVVFVYVTGQIISYLKAEIGRIFIFEWEVEETYGPINITVKNLHEISLEFIDTLRGY